MWIYLTAEMQIIEWALLLSKLSIAASQFVEQICTSNRFRLRTNQRPCLLSARVWGGRSEG